MSTLLIEGGRRLSSGRITVDGNKNAALPLLAACLLSDEPCTLDQHAAHHGRRRDGAAPRPASARESAGRGTSTVTLDCAAHHERHARPTAGRAAARLGPADGAAARAHRRVRLAPPGGDFPTRRTIATHVQALVALGARPLTESGYELDAPDGLKGASFYLDEASVTGTETALLAAAAAEGTSEIRHAATEPHVVELCEFLQAMGVQIEGAGTSTIRVHGTRPSRGASHRLNGDYIEAGSWAVVAAITGGEVEVRGVRAVDMEPITSVLAAHEAAGASCASDGFSVARVEPRGDSAV